MNITEANIKQIAKGIPVGDFSPFTKSDTNLCDQYVNKICAKFKDSKVIETTLEPDSYSSGYASYFDLFITKKDKSCYVQKKGYVEIQGISLYISRLAPIAVLGANKRTKNSLEFMTAVEVDKCQEGNWTNELNEIRSLLNIYRYVILPQAEIEKPLWFDIDIPTVMGTETVFDALFYWAD